MPYDCVVARTKPKSAAEILRDLRNQQGKSLRSVASDIGITPSNLSRMERGERPINEEVSQRIADYYGVSETLVTIATGRVPKDILKILQDHPEVIDQIRKRFGEGYPRESK